MENQNTYIILLAGLVTGGPETFHQVCDVINKSGKNKAYMVYIDNSLNIVNANVPEPYKKYNIFTASKIEDTPNNLVIVSETSIYFLTRFKFVKKAICFLSLDYYRPAYRENNSYRIEYSLILRSLRLPVYFLIWLTRLFKQKSIHEFKVEKIKDARVSYNCEYEEKYLRKKKISNLYYLCGPISQDYFNVGSKNIGLSEGRDLNILFNPKKGLKFTLKIIKAYKKFFKNDKVSFVPIQNMSNKEIQQKMLSSRLYIDFGYFPGPERLPRQAVIMGCNIITSTLGAAKFNDVKIPSEYKFNVSAFSIFNICQTIHELTFNYSKHFHEFDDYRDLVYYQNQTFADNVMDFISFDRT
jgi:hypothetical protein